MTPRPDPITRFWSAVTKGWPDGCWLWAGYTSDGYGTLYVHGKQERAHRLSWMIHNGPIPGREHVLHRCDQPACVNPDHLFLGDHRTNIRDAAAKGRMGSARGSKNNFAKLTEDDVVAIVERIEQGDTNKAIAADYGIAKTNVHSIRHGNTWNWLTKLKEGERA